MIDDPEVSGLKTLRLRTLIPQAVRYLGGRKVYVYLIRCSLFILPWPSVCQVLSSQSYLACPQEIITQHNPILDFHMAGIRAILRDAPAGQLGRLYLGLKIAPYADEQEGYVVGQQHDAEEDKPELDAAQDIEKDDESEKDSSERGTPDKDIEHNAGDESSKAQPKSDPNAVDWTGPSDLDNPQNWSTLKKTFVFGQICLLTFAS
jgi:hypothetical protein